MSDVRYSRLERFAPVGRALSRWRESSCAVVGLGGLGCGLVQYLARLGVARLILIDRDTVGHENLGHQLLYSVEHAERALPKAQAAADAVHAINPEVAVTLHIDELTRHNADQMLGGADMLLDGLDNYFTRFTVNDYAVKTGKPYFYAGVVRGELSAKAVIPGKTSCLRCLLDAPPAPGEVPTCAAEGVFAPLLAVANALQLDAANRWLQAGGGEFDDTLYSLDTADWQLRQTALGGPRPGCPACSEQRFEYLDGTMDHLAQYACHGARSEARLSAAADLQAVRVSLEASGNFTVRANPYCVVAEHGAVRYTLFASGKVIVEGADTPGELNRFIATYLGT
ncbi:MAG TPA: hypothetical protein ENO21_04485 [Firmicutes bacterium]|nr:hypothetical protein [Bacillota bacterium]